MKNSPTGKMININGFIWNASDQLNSISLINAVVRPHPGHLKPKMVFHKQGIQIFILKIDFTRTEIIK